MSARMHVNSCRASSKLFGDKFGNFVPKRAICLQEFLSVGSAESRGSGQGLRAEVPDLFVESLKDGEVCAIAECNRVAEDGLLACEPGGTQAAVLDRQLGGLVKKRSAIELGLSAQRARRACLNYILVLLA